jgi:hypothetical protein
MSKLTAKSWSGGSCEPRDGGDEYGSQHIGHLGSEKVERGLGDIMNAVRALRHDLSVGRVTVEGVLEGMVGEEGRGMAGFGRVGWWKAGCL